MADLHKLTVQEALNAMGPGGAWDEQDAATHGGTGATDTLHIDVTGYNQLGILCAAETYISFSKGRTDIDTSNALSIPANSLAFLTIPKGLGDGVPYFNHLGVTANEVRIVLI